MKKGNKLLFVLISLTAITMTGCGSQDVPTRPITNVVDKYDHKYDDMDITAIDGKYSSITYKDYGYNSYYNTHFCPSTGNPKLLIVPVWFDDSENYIIQKENVRDDIRKAYLGTEEETGWESVSTYYYKDSFGNLNLTGVVTDWYECGFDSKYFYSDPTLSKTTSLVRSAVTWYKTNYDKNMKSFDSDGDGYLDGVILIYAAPDYQNISIDGDNLWAYTYWLMNSVPSVNNPTPCPFFWSSYDFLYSHGEDAYNRTGYSSFGSGDTSHCIVDSHCLIHEMGHVLGLQDYYDYSGAGAPSLSFSMQDHNVGAHDPFSRYSLGWVKAYHPLQTEKVTITPIEDGGQVVVLSNHGEKFGSPFDEYLVIELYTPTGLNEHDCEYAYRYYHAGPKQAGIRLWHIDSRLYSANTRSLTGLPSKGQVVAATSNTTSGERAVTLAGSAAYNQLKLLRSGYKQYDIYGDITVDGRNKTWFSSVDLFKTGDYFTMHNYRAQFPRRELINSGKELGWSIYFDEVTSESATITLIKE